MKKRIVKWMLVLVLLCSMCGCGTTAANLGMGAGAGFAASETLKGIEADLQKAKEAKLAELEQSLENLANATDDVEKTVLIAKIKALEKTIQGYQDVQQGAQLATEGTKIDWSDPEAVGGYGGTVIMALLAWYLRKKGNKENADLAKENLKIFNKYQAHKQGVQKTMKQLDQAEEMTLYNNIGEARTRLGV